MNQPDRATLWKLALAGYWLLLFTTTHVPRSFPVGPPERTDKLVHFGAFAVLAWLLATAWEESTGRLRTAHLVVVWALLAVYAAFDEITQIPVGRQASVADWAADLAGAATGLIAFVLWRRWRQRGE